MSALQEDCKKGQKWVSCTLVVFQSAYMADIQCRLIIRRQSNPNFWVEMFISMVIWSEKLK